MSKRNSNEQSLGEVINELLESYKIKGKLENHSLISKWESIVGPSIAKHTLELNIKNQVMIVRLDSPALRQELGYAKSKLIDRLNEAAGKDMITDVLLV